MSRIVFSFVFIIYLFTACESNISDVPSNKYKLNGFVFDLEKNVPISNVEVYIDDGVAMSDTNGYFEIDFTESGEYYIFYSHQNFQSVFNLINIQADTTIFVDLQANYLDCLPLNYLTLFFTYQYSKTEYELKKIRTVKFGRSTWKISLPSYVGNIKVYNVDEERIGISSRYHNDRLVYQDKNDTTYIDFQITEDSLGVVSIYNTPIEMSFPRYWRSDEIDNLFYGCLSKHIRINNPKGIIEINQSKRYGDISESIRYERN